MKLMADAKDFKTNSEKLSQLKVRVYGNTAVATYKDTYDILSRANIARTPSSPRTLSSSWAANGSSRESRRVSGEVAAYSDARTRPSRSEMRIRTELAQRGVR